MSRPSGGIFPVIGIFLSLADRERLIKVFTEWPNVPTRIVTFRELHEGQIQFILNDPEPAPGGNLEGSQVSQSIIDDLKGEGN
jgi:hypothetical protein